MSPAARSAVMARIKSKDTSPELRVRAELVRLQLSHAVHVRELPGCPDIVFYDERIAVYVDGDFWHGWRFPLWQHKLSLKWQAKIAATRARDLRNFRKIRRMGWTVVRLWEHQIDADLPRCINKLRAAIRS